MAQDRSSAVVEEPADAARRIAQVRLERLPQADLGNGYYKNPVMVGPGSDNTVVRVGSDFYMMAGGGWPDQLVWHSRDLVNWRPLTRALHKFQGHAWASDLIYHEGRFYIYTTQVDGQRGWTPELPNVARRSLMVGPHRLEGDPAFRNVVLWADDPRGPWSDPIDLQVYGYIDPGHVVDREGNRYLFFSGGVLVPLAPDGLSVTGELKKVYEGWQYPAHWVVEGHCLEAPKPMFYNGWYYLSSAQGGTAGPSTAHMGVIARAKSPEGPWENSPYNPIVHTYSREEKWWRQGHGTLIDDVEGNWWFLYTGYEQGYEEFSKQGLLLPIEWTDDGWPRVVWGVNVTDVIPMPAGENVGHGMPLSDDFTASQIGIQWSYSPEIDPAQTFRVGNGELVVRAGGASALEAPGLAVMPLNHAYQAEIELTISGGAETGLVLHGGRRGGGDWVSVSLREGMLIAESNRLEDHTPYSGNHVFVRLRNDHHDVSCYYSADGKQWTPFARAFQVLTGRQLGTYAAGSGEARFRNFGYRGLE